MNLADDFGDQSSVFVSLHFQSVVALKQVAETMLSLHCNFVDLVLTMKKSVALS
jgi:hypothetical protein